LSEHRDAAARLESGHPEADGSQVSTVIAPGGAPVREVGGDLGPGQEVRSAGSVLIGGAVDRAQVHAGGTLTVAGRAGGATLVAGGDMSLAWAHSCTISATGALRLLGPGASDCDIDVGSDLIAIGSDGAIRSGHIRVGGRLEVHELAGREGAWLRVVMCNRNPTQQLLRAHVVQPGVEIVTCGELLRFDRRHTDLRIAVQDGRAVVSSR
jgi:hypothetical protein